MIINLIRHLFIPNEKNNYRAKTLHLDFLVFYLIIVIFFSFAFKTLRANAGEVLGFATDITIDKLYQLTNSVRTQNQLSSLTYNEKLASAAQKKAADMFSKNYWAHYSPDGTTPWDFILSSGYQYQYAGENLAKNFLFSQGVLDAWMNSTSHKENILKKDYSEVGFAVINGLLNGEETTLIVQMLGKPQNSLLTNQVSAAQNTPQVIPTIAPITAQTITVIPTISNQPVILANKSTGFNLSQISLNSNIIFLTFFLFALTLDFYFAAKLRIIRVGGKHIAHLIFIGFIFIGLLFITKGSIL